MPLRNLRDTLSDIATTEYSIFLNIQLLSFLTTKHVLIKITLEMNSLKLFWCRILISKK